MLFSFPETSSSAASGERSADKQHGVQATGGKSGWKKPRRLSSNFKISILWWQTIHAGQLLATDWMKRLLVTDWVM